MLSTCTYMGRHTAVHTLAISDAGLQRMSQRVWKLVELSQNETEHPMEMTRPGQDTCCGVPYLTPQPSLHLLQMPKGHLRTLIFVQNDITSLTRNPPLHHYRLQGM